MQFKFTSLKIAGLILSCSLLAFCAGSLFRTLPSWVAAPVWAKSVYESPYTFEQTWNTSIRLLRVDMNLKIVERDEKSGYILFEYVDRNVTSSASLELFANNQGVRVVCQIPKMPTYHEEALLVRLRRKLQEEYGLPPERPPPTPNQDAGPDAQ